MTIWSFSLVIARSLPEMLEIEYSISFWRSNASRICGTVVTPLVAILLIVRWIVRYSLTVGKTRSPTSAIIETTMAQNSRPISVMPRNALRRPETTSMERLPLLSNLTAGGASHGQWNEPVGVMEQKFIQMKN